MPHRVAAFFRAHSNSNSNSFDLPTELKNPKNPKNASRRSSTRIPPFANRSPSSSGSSLQSSDGASFRMPDNAHKRRSLTGALHPSPRSSSSKIPQHQAATLDTLIESPPLVFYGIPATSSGALLSGQLKLKILDETMPIEKIEMRLSIDVTRKKPFHAHCQECSNQSTLLQSWSFLQGPSTWRRGELYANFELIAANLSQASTTFPIATSSSATFLRA